MLRLSTEGADQVIRDLRAAATESAAAGRAYDALIKAQPALATGAERTEQALRKNVDAMRGMRGELSVLGAATDGLTASLGRFGSALTSPAAAIAGLSAGVVAGGVAIARLGDEYTTTMNKLRAATGSVQAAGAVYAELVAMSQQTGASISESAGAFVRFSVAARAIGATNGEVLQLTRTIQQAGLISGASTQEAAAGVQQLGQALASGTLQGDELRSILENMPTLAEALAQQLGVSIGQLRTMGSEGQLTSDRVFQALLRASEAINKQFTELTPTMGRAFGVLGQAMVEFVGKLDQALGLSQAIARAATAAAAAVGQVSGGMAPRSPAEQADFDVAQARERIARLEAEAASLSGEPGLYATPRRGTISRAMQEAAAQTQPREERLAELRQRIEAENTLIREGLARRNQVHTEADDVRQAEEATAAARRLAAARTAQTTAFNTTRDALDQERKLRTDHATRITAIDAGLANGDTDAAGAARLRRMANEELADGLKALDAAARGRIETDESLAQVARIVSDIEKDRLTLMRDGETVTAAARTEIEKYADEQARLSNLLAAGAITQETYNRAVAAADPAVKAAREAARQVEADNKQMTDAVVRYGADRFADMFGNNQKSWKEMWQGFLGTARSVLARIASEAIIRPIIAPVVSGLGLGQFGSASGIGTSIGSIFGPSGGTAVSNAGSTQGAVSQAGQSAGLFQFGRSTGLGGAFTGGTANSGYGFLDNALNAQIAAPVNFPSEAAFQGLVDGTASNGLSVGGALGGAAGIAGGAYGIYSGVQRGGIGGYTSAAGGALSVASGVSTILQTLGVISAGLGPIGWIGAAVLAIAGALLPGQKPSSRGQETRLDFNSGVSTYAGLGGDRYSQANRDQSAAAVQSIVSLATQLGDALGGARINGNAAVGVTERGLYLDVAGRKAQFANDEAGSKALADTAALYVLQAFRSVAEGDYNKLANNSGDIASLQANLEWYEGTYKALQKVGEATNEFERQVTALSKPYDDAIAKARSLALAEDGITQKRDEAIAKLTQQRDAEVANIRESIQGRLIAAGAMGGDINALNEGVVARQEAATAAK
ncbi:tape measure protein [Sediminicoccus sp. KRV36]|uniref:tape measure protein n=1 Tax=Sediminicoccus sp. KRV36 TaxID=3133721 RepID=UPI0020103C46|nr:tape measure protein [Sediminicoccus rosea]UPY37222.1 tape measure protein [Sediminicoccus rosea]